MNGTIDILGHHTPVWELVAAGAAVIGGLVVAVVLTRLLRRWKATLGVKLAAVFALMATAVSMNTNWRFFGTVLGITNVGERAGLFAVVEGAMLTFAVQARENKLEGEDGSAGTQGTLVWVMSGLAMIPAWIEAGALAGTVRALIGPFLAALLWHYALGLELQKVKPSVAKNGVLAALISRARENLLATLGAAEPDQSALEIRQDRALNKAARLADRLDTMDHNWLGRRTRVRNALRKAVRLSGAGTDPARRRQLVELMHTTRTADQIARVEMASPWEFAAAQIEAEQNGTTLELEPSAALAELESAPTSSTEAAPSIDMSALGALLGALTQAASAQQSAPIEASAQDGALGSQEGHTSAQQGAPSAAPSAPNTVSDPWFEVPAAPEDGMGLGPASAELEFTMEGGWGYGPEDAQEASHGPETADEQRQEESDTDEEQDEEETDEEPTGRRGRGGRRELFNKLDELVAAGDLRIFDDAGRNAYAYEVTKTLPGAPISDGTVRRYAADYVKLQALYRLLDQRVADGDVRIFSDRARDEVVAEVVAEVNAAYNGGPLGPRLIADSVATYVATYVAARRAELGAPVTDEAAPEPSWDGQHVTLPRQSGPADDPFAVPDWNTAQ